MACEWGILLTFQHKFRFFVCLDRSCTSFYFFYRSSVDAWPNSLSVPYISPSGSTSNDNESHKNNNHATNSNINNNDSNNNNMISSNNNNNYYMKDSFRSVKGSSFHQDSPSNTTHDITKQSSSYFNDISCSMWSVYTTNSQGKNAF